MIEQSTPAPATHTGSQEDNPIGKPRMFGFFGGLIVFIFMLASPAPDLVNNSEMAWKVLSVLTLMLCWWITEVIPIPITSLLPIILFPVLDIMPIKEVTTFYGHYIVFLFLGGFVIALAMERWGLHLRIALYILRLTGINANGIILGFMLSTAFLSMWMSNTATTVMMIPIAASVLKLMLDTAPNEKGLAQGQRNFATAMMLGIAFAANIGGVGTLIGTPPNAVLAAYLSETYHYHIDFAHWMIVGVPFASVCLIICWLCLTRLVYPNNLGNIKGAKKVLVTQWRKLGKMDRGEKNVAVVFVLTAMMWMFKAYLPVNISDTGIAVLAAVTLFLIPINIKRAEFTLTWQDTKRLPWGILLLFGGGLSLAGGMGKSGLVDMIGAGLSGYSHLGLFALLLLSILTVQTLTQTMSNVALISVFLPMIAPVAIDFGENPLLFTICCTMAASCAFMLPMSTPPNAIVFSSGYIKITQMVNAGFVMNVISLALIMLFGYTLVSWAFDIKLGIVPPWAWNTIN